MANSRISSFSTGGETIFIVWQRCPLSGIFQTISSHNTMKSAKAAAAKELRA